MVDKVKALPRDCKFLFIIDACFGADFMSIFDEKIVMLFASQEKEEATASTFNGSHFTNSFLHFVSKNPNERMDDLFIANVGDKKKGNCQMMKIYSDGMVRTAW
jgi:hypothetical protein